jgi:hypothetical protein
MKCFSEKLEHLDKLWDYLSAHYGVAKATQICESPEFRDAVMKLPYGKLKRLCDRLAV